MENGEKTRRCRRVVWKCVQAGMREEKSYVAQNRSFSPRSRASNLFSQTIRAREQRDLVNYRRWKFPGARCQVEKRLSACSADSASLFRFFALLFFVSAPLHSLFLPSSSFLFVFVCLFLLEYSCLFLASDFGFWFCYSDLLQHNQPSRAVFGFVFVFGSHPLIPLSSIS